MIQFFRPDLSRILWCNRLNKGQVLHMRSVLLLIHSILLTIHGSFLLAPCTPKTHASAPQPASIATNKRRHRQIRTARTPIKMLHIMLQSTARSQALRAPDPHPSHRCLHRRHLLHLAPDYLQRRRVVPWSTTSTTFHLSSTILLVCVVGELHRILNQEFKQSLLFLLRKA